MQFCKCRHNNIDNVEKIDKVDTVTKLSCDTDDVILFCTQEQTLLVEIEKRDRPTERLTKWTTFNS